MVLIFIPKYPTIVSNCNTFSSFKNSI